MLDNSELERIFACEDESDPSTPAAVMETDLSTSSKRPRDEVAHQDCRKRRAVEEPTAEDQAGGQVARVLEEPINITEAPSLLEVSDPRGVCSAFSSFSEFVLLLRDILGPAVVTFVDRAPGGGYKIKARSPALVVERLEARGLVAAPLVRTVDVIVRGVPVGASEEEVRRDLVARLHLQEAPAVRRLHAHSGGVLDKDRPIPVVVVSIPETQRTALSSWRFLDVMPVRCSVADKRSGPVQCFRCFQWGHRAAACRGRRRCIRCGQDTHTADACPESRSAPRCVVCGGGHMATWGGCPEKAKFVQRQRQQQLQQRQQQQQLQQRQRQQRFQQLQPQPGAQPQHQPLYAHVVGGATSGQLQQVPSTVPEPSQQDVQVSEPSRSLAQEQSGRKHKAKSAAKQHGGGRFIPPPLSQLVSEPQEQRISAPAGHHVSTSPRPVFPSAAAPPVPSFPGPELWSELLRALADIQSVLARVDAVMSAFSRWLPGL